MLTFGSEWRFFGNGLWLTFILHWTIFHCLGALIFLERATDKSSYPSGVGVWTRYSVELLAN